MELKQDDTYRSECRYGISAEGLQVLTLLYQPLIGPDGIALYLTLAAEAGSMHGAEKHRKLFALTGLHADEFSRTVSRLEEFGLLGTWVREAAAGNSYIYELKRILTAQEFIARTALISEYLSRMGKEETEAALARFGVSALSRTGYTEITRPVAEEVPQLDRSIRFTDVYDHPGLIRGDALWPQFSAFIARTSTLIFPAELRTPENLNLICRLAAVNGLSIDTVREITAKCVDMTNMTFNADKLKVLAARAKPEPAESEDPYSLPPAAFLQLKQPGIPVTGADRSILQYLAADMHFTDEVINVMVEYVLKVSSNRLNSKFIESVAGEWARDGIRTREQAIAQTEKTLEKNRKTRPHITVETPEYYRKQKDGKLPESHKASAETISKIREMQKKMGG